MGDEVCSPCPWEPREGEVPWPHSASFVDSSLLPILKCWCHSQQPYSLFTTYPPTIPFTPMTPTTPYKFTTPKFVHPAWTALLSSRLRRLLPIGQSPQGIPKALHTRQAQAHHPVLLCVPILVNSNTIHPGTKPETSLPFATLFIRSRVQSILPSFVSLLFISIPQSLPQWRTLHPPLSSCQSLFKVFLPQVFSSSMLLLKDRSLH